MIQLKPIDSAVQKTLIEKIKQSGKKERPVQEPLSGDKGNYMQSRTTWARMISLSVPKDAPNQPIVISAGEEIVDPSRLSPANPTSEAVKNKAGETITVAGKTQKITGKLRGEFADVYQTDNYNRPMAGLKSISTRIQGQSKAVRTADIKWICWDFKTLQRLTPYFLSPGVSVALEFGWMWPKHIPQEFIYDNWANLDARKIGDLSRVVKSKGQGNQELVYGIVKNFTWSGRDDGGFDCSTEIVSPSSNVFSAPLGDSETVPMFEIPADIQNQIRHERSLGKSKAKELKGITESAAFTKVINEDFPTDDIQNIPPKILFENFREHLLNMKYIYEDGGVLEAGGEAGWGNSIDGENEEYKDTILVEQLPREVNSNIEEAYVGPYITYGWFEDNILNRFVSKVHDKNKVGFEIRSVDFKFKDNDGISYYESVKINNDVANLLTTDATEVIIPGQWPMDLDFMFLQSETGEYKDIPTSGEGATNKVRKALVRLSEKIKELPAFAVEPIDEEALKEDDELTNPVNVRDALGRFASKVQFRKLKKRDELQRLNIPKGKDGEAPQKQKGYLRNLVIHARLIEEEMGNANTLEDGLMNLMKRISRACGDVWEFKLSSDPDNEFKVKVIEDSSIEQPVKSLLGNKSIDLETGEIANGYADKDGNVPNPGLMVFPTWQVNSIVYNQNMVTKLPTQMATAAIYGRNLDTSEKAVEDLSIPAAAKAIGKLFNSDIEEPKNPKDKLLSGMKRVMGSNTFENWGYNAHPKGGLVPELLADANYPGNIKGTELEVDKIVQIYTQKQIMEILEDGTKVVDEDGKKVGFFKGIANFFVNMFDSEYEYRYLYSKAGKMRPHYKNALLYFLKQAPDSIEQTKDIMTPIELSVTIDGTGGIFAGEAFSSTYIPKRYREACVFQIMDVAHELDSAGWKTTLRGLMRIDYGFGAKKPLADTLRELLEIQEKTNPNDPPYLSFSDYLTKNIGKESPYKPKPPKPEVEDKINTDRSRELSAEVKAEKENTASNPKVTNAKSRAEYYTGGANR